MTALQPVSQQGCFRHPDRLTGVTCVRCGRPICPDDMIEAATGYVCPICARGLRQPARVRALNAPPRVTYAILGLMLLGYVGQILTSGGVTDALRFDPVRIALRTEWWRVVTVGFVHATDGTFGTIHVLLNGSWVWILGRLMERGLGGWAFATLYLASLTGGSLGAVLVEGLARGIGASGAVYGLFGARFVLAWRARSLRQDDLVLLLVFVVWTFAVPGISIGGHMGGLAAGMLVGAAFAQVRGRRGAKVLAALIAGVASLLLWAAAIVASHIIVAPFAR